MLFQSAVSRTVTDHNYSHNDHNKNIEARAAAIQAEQSEVREATKIMEILPPTFHQSLIRLMAWRGVTNEALAEKSLLSPKTIQRMRTDPDYKCDMDTVVAVCFGLQLPPYISNSLIEKAGLKIRVGEKGITYSHLLATQYKNTIHEVNEYLEVAGYPRLSGNE
jgi:DNA-binding Xre family transcriptional regulator